MTDTDSKDTPPPEDTTPDDQQENSVPELAEEDSTGDPWLDKLLSEGILKGQARIELAQTLLAAFMIFSIGWIAYSATATSPFLLKDHEVIVNQENLHHIATIPRAWNDEISPINALTLAINWRIGDGSPYPFQSTQIIIHLLNALLVFLLCRSLTKNRDTEAIPMTAGLIFALYPLAAQTVNTLTDRDTLLATFFTLLSLTLYTNAIKTRNINWLQLTLSLISFALAWTCASWTATIPILIILITIATTGWSGVKTNLKFIALYIPVTILLLAPKTILLDPAQTSPISTQDVLQNTNVYPASAPLAFILPLIINALPKGKPRATLGLITTAILIVCVAITHTRNTDHRDEIYYWQIANAECPECFEPYLRLAQLYKALGDKQVNGESTKLALDLANKHWKTAEGFLTAGTKTDPDLGPHYQTLARLQHAQGNLDGAIESILRLITTTPQNNSALRDLAHWHNQRYAQNRDTNDLRQSVSYLKILQTRGAMTDPDHLIWATNLYQLGSHPQAAFHLKQIRDPEVRKQATQLSRLLQPRITTITTQQDSFNKALTQQAPVPDLLRLRAAAFLSEGRVTNARYLHEEIIRLTQNENPEDWYALATTSYLLRDWETFQTHWKPPAQLQDPWTQLATHNADQNQWSIALQALLQRSPINQAQIRHDALTTLANMALQKNNPQQAARILQQMTKEFPNNPQPWLALTDIAIEAKQFDAIQNLLREAQSRGATQIQVESRRSQAGLKQSPADQLQPTIIQ